MARQVGLVEYLLIKIKHLLSKVEKTSPSSSRESVDEMFDRFEGSTRQSTRENTARPKTRNYTKSSIYINGKKMGETSGGDHIFMVNGKQLKPGTPEYEAAIERFDLSMEKFERSMEDFDKKMQKMNKDMEHMFKW